MQNVVHACSASSKQAQTHANRNHASILSKIMRCFCHVWDISTFKRSFHCIMRAERSAPVLQRRRNPRHTQIAITPRFWRKLSVISLPFQIFRRLNTRLTPICTQNVVHAFSIVESSPDKRESQSVVDFVEHYAIFLSRSRYFDVQTIFSLHYACRT